MADPRESRLGMWEMTPPEEAFSHIQRRSVGVGVQRGR
jgi:hypothetical protein